MSDARCPIWDMPDHVTDRWDAEAICASLGCPACPRPWWEDAVGWGSDGVSAPGSEQCSCGPGSDEIPF